VHEAVEPDRSWREVRHAYQVGWLAGRNPRYAAHGFGEADVELRAAWVQAHLHDEEPVPWEDVRERARAGWRLARDGS
jgi:hypothetical protein